MSEYTSAINFIDLSAQQKLIRSKIDLGIKKVLDHGQYIMGPEVREFEATLQIFTGAKHAITCANGTDALTLVLMAWGVGYGDAVFVPSFTYVASAEAPSQIGATPFFIDVCEETFNINPESFKQAILDCKGLGLNPAAVIVVDLFGQPADVDSITNIAHSENIKVLVDAAQSFGASSKGRCVGTMGDATTTSFFPAKPLGCYGDGGAVLTDNDNDAELIKSIRLHGKGSEKYDNVRIGLNSRLDTIQASILLEKIKIFHDELSLRDKVAEEYESRLSEYIKTPMLPSYLTSAWAQYTLRLGNKRDFVKSHLNTSGISSVIYYPLPLCEQAGYKHFPSVSTGTEVSKALSKEVLSLPMHPYLKKHQIGQISDALLDACKIGLNSL